MESPGARWMREMKALEAAILERAAASIPTAPARAGASCPMGRWGGRTKATARHRAVRHLDEWLEILGRQHALNDVPGFWTLRLFLTASVLGVKNPVTPEALRAVAWIGEWELASAIRKAVAAASRNPKRRLRLLRIFRSRIRTLRRLMREARSKGLEVAFEARVIRAARAMGWRVGWTAVEARVGRLETWGLPAEAIRRLKETRAGHPDLILLHPDEGFPVLVELKRDGVAPRPDQKAMLGRLAAAGVEVRLWHPGDWEMICRRLKLPHDRRILSPSRIPGSPPASLASHLLSLHAEEDPSFGHSRPHPGTQGPPERAG